MSQPLQETLANDGEEGRAHDRFPMILRVGVVEQAGRTSFCLIGDLSLTGTQIRVYTSSFNKGPIGIRVADEPPVAGEIVWIKDALAGIKFDSDLDPDAFLRIQQKLTPLRRRSMPRIKVVARAVLRTGGRKLPAVLCDISSIGAKVRTNRALRHDLAVVLDLPDLPPQRAHVRWTHELEAGVAFEKPITMQEMADWIDGRMKVSL